MMKALRFFQVTFLSVIAALCLVWLFFRAAQAGAPRPAATATLHNVSATENDPIRLLQADGQSLVLELITPEVVVEQAVVGDRPCQILRIDGFAMLGEPGAPLLPARGAWVGVPPDGEPSVTVLEEDVQTLEGRFVICSQGGLRVDFDEQGAHFLGYEAQWDAAIYAQDRFLPSAPVELAGTGYVRSQRLAQLRFQPLQYNPLTGEARLYTRLRVQVNYPSTQVQWGAAPTTVDEGRYESVLSSLLLNYEPARRWRVAPLAQRATKPQSAYLDRSTSAPLVKLLVAQVGIQRLTYADLQAIGIPVEEVDARTFRLYERGVEVALMVTGEADASFDPGDEILFYGRPADTKWSNVGVYWLAWGDSFGLRMSQSPSAPEDALPTPLSFTETAHIEKNLSYVSARPSGANDDRWYWATLAASDPLTSTKIFTYTYPFSLTAPTSQPVSLTLRGLLYGISALNGAATAQHHTRIYLNQRLIHDFSWPARGAFSFEVRASQSLLVNGTNTIRVVLPMDELTFESFHLNWFEIEYARALTAMQDWLAFSLLPGNWEVQVDGFSSPAVQVYDITTPTQPVQLTSVEVQNIGGEYRVRFAHSSSAPARFIALTEGAIRSVDEVILDQPSDLINPANGADYLVITHQDFYTAVQPLANDRAARGLRVKTVKVQDVYDEFNFGLLDPQAIRNFLAYAYHNWQPPAPTYVLLVGDGTFDPLDYLGDRHPEFIPPYLADVDYWIGETAADNRYVSISGDDILPDMALGRLPVNTPAETTAMVNKILAYEQNPPQEEWNRKVMFIADNADAAGDFALLSDQIADFELPGNYTPEKIYYKVTHPNEISARNAITEGVNQGRLLVSYVGHAAVQYWAQEALFSKAYLSELTNADRLPLMLPMTCLDGYFIWPKPAVGDYSSLGELVVRLDEAGAIASFSPAGFGVAHGHDYLERGLFRAIFAPFPTDLGLATLRAKLYLNENTTGFSDLIETYTLFGDPATRLQTVEPLRLMLPLMFR